MLPESASPGRFSRSVRRKPSSSTSVLPKFSISIQSEKSPSSSRSVARFLAITSVMRSEARGGSGVGGGVTVGAGVTTIWIAGGASVSSSGCAAAPQALSRSAASSRQAVIAF